MQESLTDRVKAQAKTIGFSDVRITRPDAIPLAASRLSEFLAKGHHGQMTWMSDRAHWRGDPAALWPEAKSVVMLAETYGPDQDPMAALDTREAGAISVYAQGRDYHDVVKKRLKRLGRWMIDQAGGEIKVFVDTAPVMEKPLAAAAGLGWQGKHTNLVSRELGSWFFLGAVFTTLDLDADPASDDHCGGCRRCLDICPTAAFPAPYQLDARRCISYLNIELKGPVPRELRPLMGNRIYGCDDCLAVCPWNKFAQAAHDAYAARPTTEDTDLIALAGLDDASFRARFSGSPIKRIGRGRFLRNVLIALGNAGGSAAVPVVTDLTKDADPLVRGAAVWALSRLVGPQDFETQMRQDADPDVAQEWRLAAQDLGLRPAETAVLGVPST